MVQNGNIPLTQLGTVLNGQHLIRNAIPSVVTLVHVARLLGETVSCPSGGDSGISGYRNRTVQALFVAASHGDRSAMARCNIDPAMHVTMGAVGQQSHGWGDRIDLLFNGHSPNASDLTMAKRYGHVQEFSDDDPNHFHVVQTVFQPNTIDVNRIVCRFLNSQSLSVTSTTVDDGRWPTKSKFSLMLQEYGAKQHGWYPQPQYKIDGEAGPRTAWVRNRIMTQLWTS